MKVHLLAFNILYAVNVKFKKNTNSPLKTSASCLVCELGRRLTYLFFNNKKLWKYVTLKQSFVIRFMLLMLTAIPIF